MIVELFAQTAWHCACGRTARSENGPRDFDGLPIQIAAHNRDCTTGKMEPFVRIIGLRYEADDADNAAREVAESIIPGSTVDWSDKPEFPLWQEFIF